MADKPNSFISETKHWEVYLNQDQYYLGRCVIAVKRNVGAMSDLTDDEWLDFADLVALNKFDKRGALDAIRDVKKQYQRKILGSQMNNHVLPYRQE